MSYKSLASRIYIHLDGDGVGDVLELMLLDDDLEAAEKFSEQVSDAIDYLCGVVSALDNAKVLFSTGDGLVIAISEDAYEQRNIQKIMGDFLSWTGCTMSAGIGNTPSKAVSALRRAKLLGKNRIVNE